MPPQLQRAKRPKRSEPRLIVELLPNISIGDLCRWKVFPDNWYAQHKLEMLLRYPWARNLIISRKKIEINHVSGYTQRIGIHWVRTGFGKPRPIFVCKCGYGARRLFLRHGSLACKHCHGLIYASQVCSKRQRSILQAQRIHSFLTLKSYMSLNNRQHLEARITTKQELKSKRLAHHSIQQPQHNYGTRGAMHWR